MFRLILMVLFVAAVATVIAMLQSFAVHARPTGDQQMPKTFQRIAYILLVLLLLGLSTGWLGGV